MLRQRFFHLFRRFSRIGNGFLAVALMALAFAPLNVAHSASNNSHSIHSVQLTLADLPGDAQAAISAALQRAKLTVSNGKASDYLGDSVAISADGNTIVVGAQNGSLYNPSEHEGLAYVFVKPGGGWSSTSSYAAQLANGAGAESGDLFGWSVAISADGNTVVIGAPFGGLFSNHGEAYVFYKPGGGWGSTGTPMYQDVILTASDGATNDGFGNSVAISGDAGVIVVGANGDDIGANADQGSAYVFLYSPPFWGQSAKLTASNGAANDWFGNSVSISGDGGAIVVGAYGHDFNLASNVGSAYVFVAPFLGWTDMTETTELAAVGVAHDDQFGDSVAISADGNAVVVGAFGANAIQGAAYLFVKPGGGWSGVLAQPAKLAASDGAANDAFGISVAISADGNTVVVGAFYGGSADQGAAYLFVKPGGGWTGVQTQSSKLTASDGAANDRFGNSVSISANGIAIAIGAPWSDIVANVDQGSAYVFDNSKRIYLPLVIK